MDIPQIIHISLMLSVSIMLLLMHMQKQPPNNNKEWETQLKKDFKKYGLPPEDKNNQVD